MGGDFRPWWPAGWARTIARTAARVVTVKAHELDGALSRLRAEFPDVPGDAVASIMGDSYQLVVTVSGQPLVDRAEDLARLRLEVRTRHAAFHSKTNPKAGAA